MNFGSAAWDEIHNNVARLGDLSIHLRHKRSSSTIDANDCSSAGFTVLLLAILIPGALIHLISFSSIAHLYNKDVYNLYRIRKALENKKNAFRKYYN